MASRPRIVLDTNVFISGVLAFNSIPGLTVQSAMRAGTLLVSDATFFELSEVLQRRKFARLASDESVKSFRGNYQRVTQMVQVVSHISACRDPRDDKFLELAVDGHADMIVSGDEDLLSLDPFQGIRILSPQAFLMNFAAPPEDRDRT
jgi:putative PIN family toxin of toxin-antitoxin system